MSKHQEGLSRGQSIELLNEWAAPDAPHSEDYQRHLDQHEAEKEQYRKMRADEWARHKPFALRAPGKPGRYICRYCRRVMGKERAGLPGWGRDNRGIFCTATCAQEYAFRAVTGRSIPIRDSR